jgi:hypothetical protein
VFAKMQLLAERYPDGRGAAKGVKLPATELEPVVAVGVRSGNMEHLQHGLWCAGDPLPMKLNRPLADLMAIETGNLLRFDPKKKSLFFRYRNITCGKPVPFTPKVVPAPVDPAEPVDPSSWVGLSIADRVLFYKVEPRYPYPDFQYHFNKDYVVSFNMGLQIVDYSDLRITVNGLPYLPEEIMEGLWFDVLPDTLNIDFEGTALTGERHAFSFKMKLNEPKIEAKELPPPPGEEEPTEEPFNPDDWMK